MREAQEIEIADEFADIDSEIEVEKWWDFATLTPTKLLLLSSVIIALGVYVGDLLYGVNSLSILEELTQQKLSFKDKIDRLKEENARLQKEYFELKGLEPK